MENTNCFQKAVYRLARFQWSLHIEYVSKNTLHHKDFDFGKLTGVAYVALCFIRNRTQYVGDAGCDYALHT